jgi:hypothetical protein
MDPFVGGAILGSAVIGTAGSLYANRQNLKFNEDRFNDQVNLANTAHQREVRDLKAAGLNPILSAQGSGASVPSLGVADQINPAQGISDALNSAAHYMSEEYKANVDSIRADTEHTNLVNDAQAAQNHAIRAQADADVNSARASEMRSKLELAAMEEIYGMREFRNFDGDIQRYRNNEAYNKSKGLVKEGIISDLKNRANANLRANIGVGLDALDKVSGVGFKGAAAKAASKRAKSSIKSSQRKK